MKDDISLALVQSVVDSQKDLIVLFKGDEPILANSAFNKFFDVSSFAQYKDEFGEFVDNFVLHPSYFNRDKMIKNESWFDSILKLSELDRVVSMISPTYDPHAFSVQIDANIEDFTIVTFSDISQDLIKRIMIENNVNMDKESGAYAKKYFLHISQSYEDAAAFNEKSIGTILIAIDNDEDNFINSFVAQVKNNTRQDDMIIRWSDNKFLIIFLVDGEHNAQIMLKKLECMISSIDIELLEFSFSLKVQKNGESVGALLKRVSA